MWLATLFAQALTLSVEDTSALRATLDAQAVRLDAETTPGVTLQLKEPRVAWVFGYHPTLAAYDLAHRSLAEPSVMHNAKASASIGFRRSFLTLAQTGTYGEQNLRVPKVLGPGPEPLAAEPAPAPAADMPPGMPEAPAPEVQMPEPTPAPVVITPAFNRPIRYGSAASNIGVGHVLSPRLTLTESLGYTESSGLNAAARVLYPRQHQVSLSLGLGNVLTRRDGLASTLSSQFTSTAKTDALIVTGGEQWSHRFSARANGTLGAGVAYTRSEDPEGSLKSVLPVANAGISLLHQRRRVLHSLALATSLAPQVDRASGAIDSRAGWAITGTRTEGRLTLSLNSTGTSSLDTGSPRKFLSVGGALGANYVLSSEFALALNLGGTWQDFAALPAADPLWFGTLQFTYQMRPEPL